MESKRYELALSDGNRWQLQANHSELHPWIDQLATIMELPEKQKVTANQLLFSRFGLYEQYLTSSNIQPPSLIPKFTTPYLRTSTWNGGSETLCELDLAQDDQNTAIVNMLNVLFPIYQNSILKGGLPFHTAFLELNGHGVLLAASGDTGKSTCYSRVPHPWKGLCDDEVLIVLDPTNKQYRAHPFPTWSDYLMNRCNPTWNVQYSVPLSGLFFIEQATVDEATPLGQGESLMRINESATQTCRRFLNRMDPSEKSRQRSIIFDNAWQLAKAVPAFRLGVTLEGTFWKEIERVMNW